MTTTDGISDMLTRIRNAYRVKHESVEIFPFSKTKKSIVDILKKEGFILDYKVIGDEPKKGIKALLKYDENKKSVITMLKRISKPGRRIYLKKAEIPKVLSGFGISVISTNKGLMTGYEARKSNLGGEVICHVA